MLNSILNIVKEKAMDAISQNPQVPAEKRTETVQATTSALAEGLKQNLNINNLSSLAGLFGGGNSRTVANPVVSNIQSTVANQLAQKVGLPQGVAAMIAASVVSAVMSTLTKKVNDPEEKGFSLESIAGALSGSQSANSGGDLLGSLGKFLK